MRSVPRLPSSREFVFAPAWVCDIWIRSSASPRPARSLTAVRSACPSGAYWNQPMSSATRTSVGPSPSRGANTAAVAVSGRCTPAATSCVAAPHERE